MFSINLTNPGFLQEMNDINASFKEFLLFWLEIAREGLHLALK